MQKWFNAKIISAKFKTTMNIDQVWTQQVEMV